MKNKSIYRVFDWDTEGEEEMFDTLKEAKERYNKRLENEPEANLRLYKDTEKPYLSGNFIENCLMSNIKD